ncbi:thioredoxin [Saccharophagus degradans]|uniref:Thioredoxin n=1 Tax=Saccharophagus degradans TaxID=86304 RepID=A0AAW7X666_9GAMM|nr:thioredoxin [Saccharophagus degradans]MDO6421992.1 thioredoxin [Saccharophagus degradans]MDO6606315.1 thioredoxin [Saccharophagus degradans]
MSEHIVEITLENAQAQLIEESFNRPVLIDFWAEWCEPCKSLMPVLEKLANEYAGQFLLAKVNADELNMIASQFGVRSLPTVMVMKDGQPVDGFNGAQPEQAVRELLNKYLPKPWELALGRAKLLMEEEKYGEAIAELTPAYEESMQAAKVLFALVDCYINIKRFEQAEELLDSVKLVDQQDAEYGNLRSQLDIAKQAGKSPEIETLEVALAADPDNIDIKMQLAAQYTHGEYHKDALELLFPLLRKSLNAKDGEVKKQYVDILAVLGKGDPLAVEYQRKLYTLMY